MNFQGNSSAWSFPIFKRCTRSWKYFAFSSEMYNEDTFRGSCWIYGKRHRFPLLKKERTYNWRNGKRIHHTLKWTSGASYNPGKKLSKSFLISCHENGSIGVKRFEKCLSTKIMSAFFLIHIRMCLLQVLDNLRISTLYLIVRNIQELSRGRGLE